MVWCTTQVGCPHDYYDHMPPDALIEDYADCTCLDWLFALGKARTYLWEEAYGGYVTRALGTQQRTGNY